jgi:hemerythrin-like domain-containing protein
MRRDRSLIPLSHQHHNGLALCVLTERDLDKDGSPESVRRLADRIVSRFEIELVNHFELEEQLLFPVLEGTAVAELVHELTAEHRQMEQAVSTLREGATRESLVAFTALLRSHIRKEENVLFEQAQGVLPRETLDRLGVEFEARAVRVCLTP